MKITFYDYTKAKGNIILELDMPLETTMVYCTSKLITIANQDYEIFETKIDALCTKLDIAIRKH